jgi:mono/diheme cytochrome c family protein
VKRFIQWSLSALGLLALAIGTLLAYASWLPTRKLDVPYPQIKADTSPAAVQHGKELFEVACAECHRAKGETQAAGQQMTDIPEFLGKFYTANITSDPEFGIGKRSDGEIARIIRTGVNHEGRMTIMPARALGDSDVAAILGYLRSSDPIFAPSKKPTPKTEYSLAAKAIFLMNGLTKPRELPASGIPVPQRAATKEYGHYLAHEVYDCGACHTAGFAAGKVESEKAFAGGFEFVGADGKKIHSANLTFHETGLKGWSEEEFGNALRNGLRPDGTIVRPPMPRFRTASDVDVAAMYVYLSSLKAKESAVPLEARRVPVQRLAKSSAPEDFQRYGCVTCHGVGAAYRDHINSASSKPAEQLASWIRNPEQYRPGTAMPSYASVMDEATAKSLAEWIREGKPGEI